MRGSLHHDIDLVEIQSNQIVGFVDIACSRLGRRLTIGKHIPIIGAGRRGPTGVFDTGNKPDFEVVAVAKAGGTGGDASFGAKIPYHLGAGTSGGDRGVGNETG